eukprot:562222-Pyramimonas_sp.AAC.1
MIPRPLLSWDQITEDLRQSSRISYAVYLRYLPNELGTTKVEELQGNSRPCRLQHLRQQERIQIVQSSGGYKFLVGFRSLFESLRMGPSSTSRSSLLHQ